MPSLSVAGLRNSLDDARGNLSLTFVGIANAIDHVRSVRGDAPAIVFWENVPGVLNTKDNAFGCFLGALAGESEQILPPGEKWTNAGCMFGPQRTVAWRVLDAQYFGVAQRRRRVFVVASARNDINLTEILFEFDGVRRDTPQSRKDRQSSTSSTDSSLNSDEIFENHGTDSRIKPVNVCPTVTSRWGTGGNNVPLSMQPVGIDSYNLCETGNLTQTLKSPQGGVTESIGAVRIGMAVRRLTPTECERLQGFPDGYTNIPWRGKDESPDGPRYKALGNSWAVPVVAWIGQRIKDQIQ